MTDFFRSLGLSILFPAAAAQAVPVDVKYSVTGSAKNWIYEFAFSNKLDSNWRLFLVGVELENPGAIQNNGPLLAGEPYSNKSNGGSEKLYKATWVDIAYYPGIAAGSTMHLVVTDSSDSKENAVSWFAYAISSLGSKTINFDAMYAGPHSHEPYAPLFEGQALVIQKSEAHTRPPIRSGLPCPISSRSE